MTTAHHISRQQWHIAMSTGWRLLPTNHPSPWSPWLSQRQNTYSWGAKDHCQCCRHLLGCYRKVEPSHGSNDSSGCCCRPRVRGRRCISTQESWDFPQGASPRHRHPGTQTSAHVPRDHCTFSHSPRSRRRRCSCTALRSKSAERESSHEESSRDMGEA